MRKQTASLLDRFVSIDRDVVFVESFPAIATPSMRKRGRTCASGEGLGPFPVGGAGGGTGALNPEAVGAAELRRPADLAVPHRHADFGVRHVRLAFALHVWRKGIGHVDIGCASA